VEHNPVHPDYSGLSNPTAAAGRAQTAKFTTWVAALMSTRAQTWRNGRLYREEQRTWSAKGAGEDTDNAKNKAKANGECEQRGGGADPALSDE
jgi:hypothetical protein